MDNLPLILTNKQCAELLKPMLKSNAMLARGCGKSLTRFYTFQALARAVMLLENTPDEVRGNRMNNHT